jgi:Domain of unknown function (DUF4385)/Protein of unknown function (DUF3253)
MPVASRGVTASVAERLILKLVSQRSGKTICPSEVARALDPENFRPLMPLVRTAASRLQQRGRIVVSQRGREVTDISRAKGAIRLALAPSDYRGVDFRRNPEQYQVGRGEQGVLSAEPYKSELLPLWRFKTAEIARASAAALWQAFMVYCKQGDFVGMDMARKYLQMGFTRARRYANHSSGKKYDARGNARPSEPDAEKARAAEIFYAAWQRAERSPSYRRWRRASAAAARKP